MFDDFFWRKAGNNENLELRKIAVEGFEDFLQQHSDANLSEIVKAKILKIILDYRPSYPNYGQQYAQVIKDLIGAGVPIFEFLLDKINNHYNQVPDTEIADAAIRLKKQYGAEMTKEMLVISLESVTFEATALQLVAMKKKGLLNSGLLTQFNLTDNKSGVFDACKALLQLHQAGIVITPAIETALLKAGGNATSAAHTASSLKLRGVTITVDLMLALARMASVAARIWSVVVTYSLAENNVEKVGQFLDKIVTESVSDPKGLNAYITGEWEESRATTWDRNRQFQPAAASRPGVAPAVVVHTAEPEYKTGNRMG